MKGILFVVAFVVLEVFNRWLMRRVTRIDKPSDGPSDGT